MPLYWARPVHWWTRKTTYARKSTETHEIVGLGPGSSSQYSIYCLRHMPLYWTRPVHGSSWKTTCARKSTETHEIVGLGPGSSSQYSIYWLRHTPLYWTRPVHWSSRRGRDSSPPPTVEGGAPEAPPEGPDGDALPEARFYAFLWLHKI